MKTIKDIIIHHSGTTEGKDYASTQHHTPESISEWHKHLWNYPSKFVKNEQIRYAGYNVIYSPRTRQFKQTRAIGEETMAVIGKNFDSLHLCIIGNYDIDPKTGKSVDPLSEDNIKDIVLFLKDIIDGNKRQLVVADDVLLNFSKTRIYPHRMFANKSCWGTSMPDNFWIKKLAEYKEVEEGVVEKEEKLTVDKIIALILFLIKSGIIKVGRKSTGFSGREDPDSLPI